MFNKITATDDIFTSEAFLKDELSFNVLIKSIQNQEKYPDLKIHSNGIDCIVACCGPSFPVIIWTDDSFNDYEKVYEFVLREFTANTPLKIFSKKPLFDFIKNKQELFRIKNLGIYKCDTLKNIECNGHVDNIKLEEIPIVAEMLVDFAKETLENINATIEQEIELAELFTSDPFHKVWRDINGKIVAITRLQETYKYDRIGRVFTPPSERGKSYAKMLVHHLTKQTIDNGKTAMLFADLNYPPANKSYIAVGYELVENIIVYQLSEK